MNNAAATTTHREITTAFCRDAAADLPAAAAAYFRGLLATDAARYYTDDARTAWARTTATRTTRALAFDLRLDPAPAIAAIAAA